MLHLFTAVMQGIIQCLLLRVQFVTIHTGNLDELVKAKERKCWHQTTKSRIIEMNILRER